MANGYCTCVRFAVRGNCTNGLEYRTMLMVAILKTVKRDISATV